MTPESIQTEAGRKYESAYSAHYTSRNVPLALGLYKQLIVTHPDTPEANYCRMQVQNIVNAVVPKGELFDAQIELALTYFDQDESEPRPKTPLLSRISE